MWSPPLQSGTVHDSVADVEPLVVDGETAEVTVSAFGADGAPFGVTHHTREYGAQREVLVLNGVP